MGAKKNRVKHLEHQVEKRFFYLSAVIFALIVLAILFGLLQR
jgi:hypothetical protein